MHPAYVARSNAAQPIWFVTPATFSKVVAKLDKRARAYVKAAGFEPRPGRHLILPSAGGLGGVLFGLEGKKATRTRSCRACCPAFCRPASIASPTRRTMRASRRWRSRSARIDLRGIARRRDKAVRARAA